MIDSPPHVDSPTPYIVAVIIGTMTGAALVFAILWLRPASDPATLITAVGAVATIITGQAILFIKSHDTGIKVDGALHKWMAAQSEKEHAMGVIEGAQNEQQRVVDQRLAASTAAGDRRNTPAAVQAVEIVSPAPLPVIVQSEKQ